MSQDVPNSAIHMLGKLLDAIGIDEVDELSDWISSNKDACKKGVQGNREQEERLREMVGLSRTRSLASSAGPGLSSRKSSVAGGVSRVRPAGSGRVGGRKGSLQHTSTQPQIKLNFDKMAVDTTSLYRTESQQQPPVPSAHDHALKPRGSNRSDESSCGKPRAGPTQSIFGRIANHMSLSRRSDEALHEDAERLLKAGGGGRPSPSGHEPHSSLMTSEDLDCFEMPVILRSTSAQKAHVHRTLSDIDEEEEVGESSDEEDELPAAAATARRIPTVRERSAEAAAAATLHPWDLAPDQSPTESPVLPPERPLSAPHQNTSCTSAANSAASGGVPLSPRLQVYRVFSAGSSSDERSPSHRSPRSPRSRGSRGSGGRRDDADVSGVAAAAAAVVAAATARSGGATRRSRSSEEQVAAVAAAEEVEELESFPSVPQGSVPPTPPSAVQTPHSVCLSSPRSSVAAGRSEKGKQRWTKTVGRVSVAECGSQTDQMMLSLADMKAMCDLAMRSGHETNDRQHRVAVPSTLIWANVVPGSGSVDDEGNGDEEGEPIRPTSSFCRRTGRTPPRIAVDVALSDDGRSMPSPPRSLRSSSVSTTESGSGSDSGSPRHGPSSSLLPRRSGSGMKMRNVRRVVGSETPPPLALDDSDGDTEPLGRRQDSFMSRVSRSSSVQMPRRSNAGEGGDVDLGDVVVIKMNGSISVKAVTPPPDRHLMPTIQIDDRRSLTSSVPPLLRPPPHPGRADDKKKPPPSPSLSVLGLLDHEQSQDPHFVLDSGDDFPPLPSSVAAADGSPVPRLRSCLSQRDSVLSPGSQQGPGSPKGSFRCPSKAGSVYTKTTARGREGSVCQVMSPRGGLDGSGYSSESSVATSRRGSQSSFAGRGSVSSNLALRARLSLAQDAGVGGDMSDSDADAISQGGSDATPTTRGGRTVARSVTMGSLLGAQDPVRNLSFISRDRSRCSQRDDGGGCGDGDGGGDGGPGGSVDFDDDDSACLREFLQAPEELDEVPTTEEQDIVDRRVAWFTKFDYYWAPVFFLYCLFQLIMIPARLGLDTPASPGALSIDLIMDFVFWAEIALRFRRPYRERGMTIGDAAAVRNRYMKGYFWWDVVSAFPAEIIALIIYAKTGTTTSPWRKLPIIVNPLWRINRLGVARYADSQFTETFAMLYAGHPLLVRAVRTVWAFTITTHYMTCFFLALLYYEGEKTGFEFIALREIYTGSASHAYFLAYDYSIKAMVGMGRPGKVMPQTDLEAVFCVVQSLVGVAIYATVLATISNMISEGMSDGQRWRNKINDVIDVLQYITKASTVRLPPGFLSEVTAYYYHDFWTSRVLLGSLGNVMTDLPLRVRMKMESVVGSETLSRVPMFKEAIEESPAFLHYMLYCLEPHTFCKGELVMSKGELGDCMYFIMAGSMSIYGDDDTVVFECKRGSSLGEIALLHDCRRTATVRAAENTSVFVLRRYAFEQAERLFPEPIALVRKEADSKLQKMKLADIVGKVPLFSKYSDDTSFIEEVVGALEPQVHPPLTTIMRKGDIGDKMFFVAQGKLTVYAEEEKEVGSLTDGCFFGEICVVFDARRTATIVTDTHAVLFTLSKEACTTVLMKYPEQAAYVTSVATARYRSFIAKDLFKNVPFINDMMLGTYPNPLCSAGGSSGERSTLLPSSTASSLPELAATHRTGGAGGGRLELEEGSPVARFLDALAARLKPRSVVDDECIVTAGRPMTHMIFVSTGTVAVVSDNDVMTDCLGPGDFYGELALMFFCVSKDTLIALRPCVIYTLSLNDFQEISAAHKEEACVLRSVSEKALREIVFFSLLDITSWGTMRTAYFALLSHCRMAKFATQHLNSYKTKESLRVIRRRSNTFGSQAVSRAGSAVFS